MTERDQLMTDVRIAEAAHEALSNEAIVAYFDRAEQQAIDALLGVDVLDDARRLRLTVVAQTIRSLRSFLHGARDMGEYAEGMLARMNREDEANGA